MIYSLPLEIYTYIATSNILRNDELVHAHIVTTYRMKNNVIFVYYVHVTYQKMYFKYSLCHINDKRFFRWNKCFLLLVYTIHLPLSSDLVDLPPPDGNHLYETRFMLKTKSKMIINSLQVNSYTDEFTRNICAQFLD